MVYHGSFPGAYDGGREICGCREAFELCANEATLAARVDAGRLDEGQCVQNDNNNWLEMSPLKLKSPQKDEINPRSMGIMEKDRGIFISIMNRNLIQINNKLLECLFVNL